MQREITPAIDRRNIEYIIRQLGSMYNPLESAREYISNGIDNYLKGVAPKIRIGIYVDRVKREIAIIDNGPGMSYEKLDSLPERIGASDKRDIIETIGNKGLGILGFISMGDSPILTYYSRDDSTPPDAFNFLAWTTSPWQARSDIVTAERLRTHNRLYRVGGTGTVAVVSNIPERILEKNLRPAEFAKALREIYHPLLQRGDVEIHITYAGGSRNRVERTNRLEPLEFSGDFIVQGEELEADLPKGRGQMEVYIWHTPKKTDGRVRAYNKGVLVLKSLCDASQFNSMPWKSGRLDGYVVENFLELAANRKEYLTATELFNSFVSVMDSTYKAPLEAAVKSGKSQAERNETTSFGSKIIRDVGQSVFRDLIENDAIEKVFVRDRKGAPRMAAESEGGARTTGGGGRPEGSPTMERHDEGRQPTQASPLLKRAYEESSKGGRMKVKPGKRYLPDFTFGLDDFGGEDDIMRSRLDMPFTVIQVNTEHPDFKRTDGDRQKRERYVAERIATELGNYVHRNLIENGAGPEEAARASGIFRDECYYKSLKLFGLD